MNNVVKTKNKDASNFFIAGEIWVEVRFFFEIMPDGTIRDSGVYQFISLQIYSIKRFEFNLKRKIEFLLRCKILEGSGFLLPNKGPTGVRTKSRERIARQIGIPSTILRTEQNIISLILNRLSLLHDYFPERYRYLCRFMG